MATTVKYYNGATLIGEGTVAPGYSFDWTNAPAGLHAITAKVFVDGVEQDTSAVVNVTVSASGDTTAPSVPTNIQVSNITATGATVTWNASSDSDTTAPSVPTGLAISNITDTGATATWNASTDN